ncbi:MAG: hypothetical protein MK081_08075 [Flavobacteriales bacterium]|nr:hypothetical protein [Flavobacteriales bacterium]
MFVDQICGIGGVWNPETGSCDSIASCTGDIDDDGTIDTSDLLLFVAHYGQTCD